VCFSAITLCVVSQRVFILSSTLSGNIWIHPRVCSRKGLMPGLLVYDHSHETCIHCRLVPNYWQWHGTSYASCPGSVLLVCIREIVALRALPIAAAVLKTTDTRQYAQDAARKKSSLLSRMNIHSGFIIIYQLKSTRSLYKLSYWKAVAGRHCDKSVYQTSFFWSLMIQYFWNVNFSD